MRIKINDKRKIVSLQEEFNKAFPYLRIEFFSRPHHIANGSRKENIIVPHNKTIGDCRTLHNSKTISVTPAMKVSRLEQLFKDEFGLYVQVFRKSGKIWLETTRTDDWTLAEQNEQGEELSKYREEKIKPFPAEDYSDLE